MITTLWIIGLIFFALSLVFMVVSDECVYRNKPKYEKLSLTLILSAVLCWGIAVYSTGNEEKANDKRPQSMQESNSCEQLTR